MSEIIVEVTRGPIVECIHRGDIAVVGTDKRLKFFQGNPGKVTYLRSSAKPFQALNIVESGAYEELNLTPRELAVACGSHSASADHVEAVRSILEKAGVKPTAVITPLIGRPAWS